jgi:hypothetical protein
MAYIALFGFTNEPLVQSSICKTAKEALKEVLLELDGESSYLVNTYPDRPMWLVIHRLINEKFYAGREVVDLLNNEKLETLLGG